MTMVTQATPATAEEKIQRAMRLNEHPAIRELRENPRMVRLTVNLPSDLVEQMRDAVYWTPGLTLAWLIARAVRTSLAELQQAHQGPFPKRAKPLRAGRPRLTGQSMKVQPPLPHNGNGGAGERAVLARAVSAPSLK